MKDKLVGSWKIQYKMMYGTMDEWIEGWMKDEMDGWIRPRLLR